MRRVVPGGVGRFPAAFRAAVLGACLACNLSGQAPATAQGKGFALLVGVPEFGEQKVQWLKFAVQDAQECAAALRDGPLKVNWVEVRTNQGATRASIVDKLRELKSMADPNSTVYLLISAWGVHRQKPPNHPLSKGVICTFQGTPEMPATTLSLDDLRAYLRGLDVSRKFVFADVSREVKSSGPPGEADPYPENTINSRMKDILGGVDHLYGLLASRDEQRSKEDDVIKRGIFSFHLAAGLRGKHNDTFGKLVEYVKTRVEHATKSQQQPEPVLRGDWNVPLMPLRSPGGGALWHRLPVALWIRPGAWYEPQDQPGFGPAWSDQDLGLKCAAMQPKDLLAWLAQFKPTLLNSGTDSDRGGVSAALEDRGQEILLRYHLGDRFPEDPRRPGKQDFEIAEHLFREALALRPPMPGDKLFEASQKRLKSSLHFCRGRIHVFDGRFKEAEDALGLASKKDPDSPDPHNALGLLYLYAFGKDKRPVLLDSAIAEFQEAIARAPDWAYPRHNLALSWIEKGEYSAAIRAYREAIQRTPQYVYLYCNLGLLFHRLNRLEEAARQYGIALRWFEAMRQEFESRRKRLEREKQAAEAEYLQTRIDLLRRYQAETHNALGALRAGFGNEAAAAEQYRRALELNCGLLAARHNLAMLSLARYRRTAPGKRKPADLEEAIGLLRLNADRREPYLRSSEKLGQAYLWKRDYAAAAEHFQAVACAQKDNLEAAAGWISALAHMEKFDKAEEQVTARFGRATPGVSEKSLAAFYRERALGEISELKGNRETACSHYRAALSALVSPGAAIEAWREVRAKLKTCRF